MITKEEIAKFEEGVFQYIAAFGAKHGLEFTFWDGDLIAGIAVFTNKMYFTFTDIVYDINSNQPDGLIIDWFNSYEQDNPILLPYYEFTIQIDDLINPDSEYDFSMN